ncbi:hypothetical protein FWD20_04110, partial [Candidatus Saccharibacteria bacterium]|nr:hypothetical protein [Candidatus Saccharibacteria bacterium]
MKIHRQFRRLFGLTGLVIAVVATVLFAGFRPSAPSSMALSGADFKPGRIIDDAVFYNKDAMTAAQIQSFLNSKVPVCDTWGTKIYSGSTTRAQSGTARGNPPPFVCLKDYRQDVPAMAANSYCGAIASGGNQTAAQIIYAVSQACGVNPQVTLVLLQKEQGLVTDDWPFQIQYRSATGYGCPDTAACDAAYYGFFNQVYRAAWQYKLYRANPNNYRHRAGQNNSIQYNPNASCGSKTVYIENQATAGLYNYTPYVPNQKALDNLYGTGDGCSAYGNRNFWRMFTDWFGSTNGQLASSGLVVNNNKPLEMAEGEKVPVTFTVSNPTNSTVNFLRIGVAARGPDNENLDLPWASNVALRSGASYTYSNSLQSKGEGDYKIFISYILASNPNEWVECAIGTPSPTCYNSFTIKRPIEMVSGLSLKNDSGEEKTSFHINQNVTASFTIKNTSQKYSANAGRLVVAGRLSNQQNVDFTSMSSEVTLAPNATYTYTIKRTFSSSTSARFFTSRNINGVWDELPFRNPNGVKKEATINILPQTTLTKGIALSSNHLGQRTVTMEVTNFGNTAVTYPMLG